LPQTFLHHEELIGGEGNKPPAAGHMLSMSREGGLSMAARRGDTIEICQKHPCCYEVLLARGPRKEPELRGTWHFEWIKDPGTWKLRHPATGTTKLATPEGTSAPGALINAIGGRRLDRLVLDIENRLGHPPPGC
jgi:hypothetical protein